MMKNSCFAVSKFKVLPTLDMLSFISAKLLHIKSGKFYDNCWFSLNYELILTESASRPLTVSDYLRCTLAQTELAFDPYSYFSCSKLTGSISQKSSEAQTRRRVSLIFPSRAELPDGALIKMINFSACRHLSAEHQRSVSHRMAKENTADK